MSRIISFFTTIFLALQSLFGIGGMAFGKVTIVPEAETYPLGTPTVSVTLSNGTWKPIDYNAYHHLEKLDDSKWVLVEPKEPLMFPDVQYVLGAFRSQKYSYDLTNYDSLQPGRYRIVAGYGAFEFHLTKSEVTLTTEFDTYPVGTQKIKATLYNGTLRPILHDPGCQLEKWDDGEWSFMEPIAWYIYEGYWLPPLQSGHVSLDLTNYDPPLETGRYRIKKGSAYAEFMLVGEGKVTLTTEFDTYFASTKAIKATLYNGSPYVFEYTTGYGVQKWDGGNWIWVGPNLMFSMDMNYLQPLQSRTFTCDLSYCDPPMEAGRYRIAVKDAYGEFTLV